MRSLAFAVVVAFAACGGPSTAEINNAKTASYVGETAAMFKIVVDTAAETYKIANAGQDADRFVLVTQPQWYNREGGRQSAGADDYVQIGEGSIRLQMIVELIPVESNRYMIVVTPKTFQHLSGSPQPRELEDDDPNLPGWVLGRVDSLYVEINKRLQNYATK